MRESLKRDAEKGATPRLLLVSAFAAALFLSPALLLSAQDAAQPAGQSGTQGQSDTQTASQGGSREMTIEELFLKSIEFQILREKATSDDRDVKLSALDDLEKRIDAGLSSSDAAQVEFVLEYLALEGSGRISRENGRKINDFPEVRRRAASLLGRVGTEEAKNALIRVLLIDDEPMVKAEAAYALGNLGMNQNNETVQAIEFAYNLEDPDAAGPELRLRHQPCNRKARAKNARRPQRPRSVSLAGQDRAGKLPSNGKGQGSPGPG